MSGPHFVRLVRPARFPGPRRPAGVLASAKPFLVVLNGKTASMNSYWPVSSLLWALFTWRNGKKV